MKTYRVDIVGGRLVAVPIEEKVTSVTFDESGEHVYRIGDPLVVVEALVAIAMIALALITTII